MFNYIIKLYDNLKELQFGEKVIHKLSILYPDFNNFYNDKDFNIGL